MKKIILSALLLSFSMLVAAQEDKFVGYDQFKFGMPVKEVTEIVKKLKVGETRYITEKAISYTGIPLEGTVTDYLTILFAKDQLFSIVYLYKPTDTTKKTIESDFNKMVSKLELRYGKGEKSVKYSYDTSWSNKDETRIFNLSFLGSSFMLRIIDKTLQKEF